MISEEIVIHTGGRAGVIDITSDVERFAAAQDDGLLSVFVPHATAGVAVIEVGAGSDDDLLRAIDDVLPPGAGALASRARQPGSWT